MWVRHGNHPDKQSGVALVTVIMVIALLTVIVSRLSLVNSIWLRQVDNNNAMVQANEATRAAQIWVADILENDRNDFDGKTDDWALPVIPIPIAWGEMYGWIEDMQSRFNINNIMNEEGKLDQKSFAQFQQLLRQLEIDPGIAEAVLDWLDADSLVTGRDGAEDIYYLGLEQSYLAANRRLIDTREIMLVKGVNQEIFNRLEPYIAALPGRTTVNVNTASPELIAAIIFSPEQPADLISRVRQWSQKAETAPFTSMDEFHELAGDKVLPVNLADLGVESNYFKAHTQMYFGDVEQRKITIYQRFSGRADILQQYRTFF